MSTKVINKQYNPKYGWVTADPKKSKDFTGFTDAQALYNKLYPVTPKVDKKGNPVKTTAPKIQKEYLNWAEPSGLAALSGRTTSQGGELLRWAESAKNTEAMKDPVYKAIVDAQAKKFTHPSSQAYGMFGIQDPVAVALAKVRKTHGKKAYDEALDKVSMAQHQPTNTTNAFGGPAQTNYSSKTNQALNKAAQLEGKVDFKKLMLSDPTKYKTAELTRYYDSPNTSLVSTNGGPFIATNAGNTSKTLGGEDLAGNVFKYYQGLSTAGDVGKDWAAVDGNQYLQKGTFGGKEAYFTPYDYAIHGVPTGERGENVVTNIANLDPNYWRTSGNLQQIGDKYGFVTQANPFASTADANTALSPEKVEFRQNTKKSGLGGIGGLLTTAAQIGIGGWNPLAWGVGASALGIPKTIATIDGLTSGSRKAPSTWQRQVVAPQWQPNTVTQPVQAPQAAQPTQPIQMTQGGMVGNNMNYNPTPIGNPVAQTAQGLASLGRNNDSMLMHVTPNEVYGLQQLAQNMGGSLSRNPSTGLPEAGFLDGFLSSVLPTLIGTGVGVATGNPYLGAATAGGLKTAQTGDLGAGILSGIGAYTGTGTYGDVARFGAESSMTPALTSATDYVPSAADIAANPQGFANATALNAGIGTTPFQTATDMGTTNFYGASPAANTTAQSMANQANLGSLTTPTLSDFTSGLSAITEPEGLTKFAAATGTTPTMAGFKLASPFIGPALESMAPQPLGPIADSSDWGGFTPISELRKRYASQYSQPRMMAEGGMVPQQYGITNQQGIAGIANQQANPAFGTFTGHNPTGSMVSPQYARGGYLNGDGDGMSDSINATIEGTQDARLSDGEFVVPADVVSHLGNGSTNAGAKQLYAMMDKVRQARTGRSEQGTEINAGKYLPA